MIGRIFWRVHFTMVARIVLNLATVMLGVRIANVAARTISEARVIEEVFLRLIVVGFVPVVLAVIIAMKRVGQVVCSGYKGCKVGTIEASRIRVTAGIGGALEGGEGRMTSCHGGCLNRLAPKLLALQGD